MQLKWRIKNLYDDFTEVAVAIHFPEKSQGIVVATTEDPQKFFKVAKSSISNNPAFGWEVKQL